MRYLICVLTTTEHMGNTDSTTIHIPSFVTVANVELWISAFVDFSQSEQKCKCAFGEKRPCFMNLKISTASFLLDKLQYIHPSI